MLRSRLCQYFTMRAGVAAGRPTMQRTNNSAWSKVCQDHSFLTIPFGADLLSLVSAVGQSTSPFLRPKTMLWRQMTSRTLTSGQKNMPFRCKLAQRSFASAVHRPSGHLPLDRAPQVETRINVAIRAYAFALSSHKRGKRGVLRHPVEKDKCLGFVCLEASRVNGLHRSTGCGWLPNATNCLAGASRPQRISVPGNSLIGMRLALGTSW
jgi:hypothetical protein